MKEEKKKEKMNEEIKEKELPAPQLPAEEAHADDDQATPPVEEAPAEGMEADPKPEEMSAVVKARVEGYARGKGIAQDVIDAAVADLTRIAASVAAGEVDLDMLEMIINGRDHKKLLAEAVREAELRGRNAAIEAKMREAVSDDGLPHLGSTGSSRKSTRRSIFSLAQSAR